MGWSGYARDILAGFGLVIPVAVAAAHCILHLLQLLWREPVRTVVTME